MARGDPKKMYDVVYTLSGVLPGDLILIKKTAASQAYEPIPGELVGRWVRVVEVEPPGSTFMQQNGKYYSGIRVSYARIGWWIQHAHAAGWRRPKKRKRNGQTRSSS